MAARGALVRMVCAAVQLRPGDEVLTPYRRWERVASVAAASAGAAVRVVTDGTGADCPWLWVARKSVSVRRRVAGALAAPVAA